MPATDMRCMCNNNLEIRIAGSSCCRQKAGQWTMSGQDDHLSRLIFGLQVVLTGQVPCKWNGMILFKLYVLSTLFLQEELCITSNAPRLNDYCIIFNTPVFCFVHRLSLRLTDYLLIIILVQVLINLLLLTKS